LSDMRFTLNSKGVQALLKSAEMESIVREKANEAVKRLPSGYEADTHVGKTRVNASIRTRTASAVKDNSKNNSLLKAVR